MDAAIRPQISASDLTPLVKNCQKAFDTLNHAIQYTMWYRPAWTGQDVADRIKAAEVLYRASLRVLHDA